MRPATVQFGTPQNPCQLEISAGERTTEMHIFNNLDKKKGSCYLKHWLYHNINPGVTQFTAKGVVLVTTPRG
jgi:hypothetical protein